MDELYELKKECLSCNECSVGQQYVDGNLSNVFSNMNPDARIMVVGQNPGADEVAEATPFVGKSGKTFDDRMWDLAGLDRMDMYITNVVHCYTPGNRRPTQQEMDNCQGFLDKEVELVDPELLIALGACAFKMLTGMSGIMKHCGEAVASPRYMRPVIALPHPSPHNTNHPERKQIFDNAVAKVGEFMETTDG